MKHGKGAEEFANGETYTGEYKHGHPDGQGKYTWPNGNTFEGGFKSGLKEGKGIWKKPVKKVFQPKDKEPIQITEYHVYEGEYKKDKKNG